MDKEIGAKIQELANQFRMVGSTYWNEHTEQDKGQIVMAALTMVLAEVIGMHDENYRHYLVDLHLKGIKGLLDMGRMQ